MNPFKTISRRFVKKRRGGDAPKPVSPAERRKIEHQNRSLENERGARHMGYTLAVSALSAKLAKADGNIHPEEVKSFRNFLNHLEEETCKTLLNEAALDTGDFEHYARRMRVYFKEDMAFLKKTLASFFDFAAADGPINMEEIVFLRKMSAIFGFSESHFLRLLEQHMVPKQKDPYAVLGVRRGASSREVKKAYYQAISAYHPDRLMALSSQEIAGIAHERVAALQQAYEKVSKRKWIH